LLLLLLLLGLRLLLDVVLMHMMRMMVHRRHGGIHDSLSRHGDVLHASGR
jgi:hypothetical protein